MIQFGNTTASIPWNKIDRWPEGAEPPDYSLYSVFQLKHYFYMFWPVMLCHLYSIYNAKLKFSVSFGKHTFFEQMIHTIENSHIPFNMEEWDIARGDARAHKERMICNRKEVLVIIFINFFYDGILLIPLFILGKSEVF